MRKKSPLSLLLIFTGVLVVISIVEAITLSLYHEEPRRLLVAWSMIDGTGWIVPRILGDVYLKKPPGFNWVIAIISMPFGAVYAWTGRLVAIISWLSLGGFLWYLSDELESNWSR
ncbi:MAG: ArnT family glycosyltransferase, partial [bacterium]